MAAPATADSVQSPAKVDSTRVVSAKDTAAFVMTKSPWKAVLYSAVVPGAGQIYNQSYWKVPLVVGLVGWFSYNYIQNNKAVIKFRDDYLRTNDGYDLTHREFYHDQRDLFAVYLGLTYALTLVDAYVDAQLFDFSVDEVGTHKALSMKFYFNR